MDWQVHFSVAEAQATTIAFVWLATDTTMECYGILVMLRTVVTPKEEFVVKMTTPSKNSFASPPWKQERLARHIWVQGGNVIEFHVKLYEAMLGLQIPLVFVHTPSGFT